MTEEKKDSTKKRAGVSAAQIITTVVLILAVIFCLTTLSQVLTKGYVSIFGISLFRVVTNSMEPQLPVGALIVSESKDISEIRENDIVCFRSKDPAMLGRIITHRVLSVIYDENEEINLQTKGDANVSVDPYHVTASNLIGKVVWSSSDSNIMAILLSILSDKFGFFLLIIVPIILIITLVLSSSVAKIRKELEQKRRELEDSSSKPETNPGEEKSAEEEYRETYDRIKAEMLEEMAKGAETESENISTEASENNGDGKSDQSDNN